MLTFARNFCPAEKTSGLILVTLLVLLFLPRKRKARLLTSVDLKARNGLQRRSSGLGPDSPAAGLAMCLSKTHHL